MIMLSGLDPGPGTQTKALKSPDKSSKSLNSSWSQVDVSKLISDLDEDIRISDMEKADLSLATASRPPGASPRPTLSLQVGGGARSTTVASGRPTTSSPSLTPSRPVSASSRTPTSLSGSSPAISQNSAKVSSEEMDKGLKMKIKRTKSGRQEIVKSDIASSVVSSATSSRPPTNSKLNGDTSSSNSDNNKSEKKCSNSSSSSMNGPLSTGGSNLARRTPPVVDPAARCHRAAVGPVIVEAVHPLLENRVPCRPTLAPPPPTLNLNFPWL